MDQATQTALLLGALAGLLGIVGRRLPLLAWLTLAPLGIAASRSTPAEAALAAAAAGAIVGAAPVFRRFPAAMVLFVCTVHALSWAAAWALAARLWLPEAPALGLFLLPLVGVAAMLPLRLLGAPRWISNPLATSQEPWLTVVHTAKLGGDLTITFLLASFGALVAVLSADSGRTTITLCAAALAALVLAAFLRYGARSKRSAEQRAEASARLRVAAVAADPEWFADDTESRRDVEAAIRRYDPALHRAAKSGARLIVLPEIAVTLGPATRGRWFDALARWSREHEVVIVAGFFDELTQQNQLAVLDADGRIVGEYEKQHPGPHEPKRHTRTSPLCCRSQQPELPPLSGVICADLDYADLHAAVSAHGGLLTVPANDWPRLAELHHRAAVWAAVATGVPVVRATGHGVSAIYDGVGRVVARQSSASGAVVLVADVPIAARS